VTQAAPAGYFESARLAFQPLGPGNEALLHHVFTAAGDYFLPLTGRAEPDAGAAKHEIEAVSAHTSRAIALVTLLESGEPAGSVGWWLGHPEEDVALLGLLMLVPELRGQGLAREVVETLAERFAAAGIRRLRTAVPTTHYAAHDFLRGVGFAMMSIRDHAAMGVGGTGTLLWERAIGGGEKEENAD
jgi:GNAT superfamily N-acetyltransferase